MHTLDELANTDLGVEVAAADAAVELLALAVGGVLVVEVAGVLHGDVITVLGLVLAVAGGDQSLGDTHVDCCTCEGSGVDWGECCWERGRKSGAREEAEGGHFSTLSFDSSDGPGTQRGGARAWGPSRLRFLGGAFFGQQGRASSARTRIPRGPMDTSPPRYVDVAIVSGRVVACDYDM